MATKIRRDDEVVVLAGKDKGKLGKVKKVLTSEGRVNSRRCEHHQETSEAKPTSG